MANEVQFEMPFPCFLPMSKQGAPELVEIDGHLSLCVFTNKKNAARFCGDRHRGAKGFPMLVHQTAGDLRDFLIANESQFVEQGCHHVAVDVQPNVPPMYAPIRDFVEYLATVG